jgi:hyperosmotically inducible periplasmic protein
MKVLLNINLAISGMILATAAFVGANETDDRIESSFTKSYVYQTYLKDDGIAVQSKDGNVSLTGKVAKESHKDLAEEIIVNLPGVKKVDNHLKIKGAPPEKDSDLWVHTKVETALLFHRNVSVTNSDITVKSGAVTIKGKADNQAQKDLTTEYVQDVEGVKSVNNQLTVAEKSTPLTEKVSGEIDDASITAQVKVSLLSHRSTSALKTHVKTTNGLVTLTGKVENTAEKDLVSKLTSDIQGVKSVINDMVVSLK